MSTQYLSNKFAEPDINTRWVGRIRDPAVMQTWDKVKGLHNVENSPNPLSVYISLSK